MPICPPWEQIGNSVAVILEPQRWLEFEERGGSYRIHFRYHGKPHILTLGKVSEDEARSKSDQFGGP